MAGGGPFRSSGVEGGCDPGWVRTSGRSSPGGPSVTRTRSQLHLADGHTPGPPDLTPGHSCTPTALCERCRTSPLRACAACSGDTSSLIAGRCSCSSWQTGCLTTGARCVGLQVARYCQLQESCVMHPRQPPLPSAPLQQALLPASPCAPSCPSSHHSFSTNSQAYRIPTPFCPAATGALRCQRRNTRLHVRPGAAAARRLPAGAASAHVPKQVRCLG